MNFPRDTGYLEIIVGPMFSGKTNKIIEIYNKYKSIYNILVINYIGDNRYSNSDIVSHDGNKIPCIPIKLLSDINDDEEYKEKYNMSDIIIINEGQFFKDIYDWVTNSVELSNKIIFICGLDGDYKRETFGNFLNLIPICDKVLKIKGVCSVCRDSTPSLFSHRLSNETTQEVIGVDNYTPLCRKCYLKTNNCK